MAPKKVPSHTKKKPFRQRTEQERRENQAKRVARIIKIIQLLHKHPRTKAELATKVECSVKTIERDVKAINLAGIRINDDDQTGRYQIPSGDSFPIKHLDDREVLGLVLATSIASTPGLDVSAGSGPTLSKVHQSIEDSKRQLIDSSQKVVEVVGLNLADHSGHQETFHKILQALLHKMRIEGEYKSPYKEAGVRLFLHPYRLCLIRQAWYLVGREDKKRAPQTYRVARFGPNLLVKTDPAQVPAQFDLKKYLGNAWTVFRGEKSYDVKLQFTPEAASLVQETVWHHTQKVTVDPNGFAIVNFTVDGLDEILWWVLGWAGRVKVLKPRELHELVVRQLESGLQMQRD